MMIREVFDRAWLEKLKERVHEHHTVYPTLPPQGIFFEALVAQAFLGVGWEPGFVQVTNPNQPQHDITVDGKKMSLKTETGKATDKDFISITKLCTTETGDWTSEALIRHTLSHLRRYDHILMLRAISADGVFEYQVLDIPLAILRRIETVTVVPSGTRTGRKSLSATVNDGSTQLFQIRFDGADGKCQIKNLRVDRCRKLAEWIHKITGS